ncbi:RNA-processing protein [Candidatus Woesearchaeota archaeon]|nr:RNA-processing protein [Candidatus Woesearchaeota archaeon]
MKLQYELKIPKERVAVLIGEKGTTKRKLEKLLKIKLTIDSDGDVFLDGEDSLNLHTGQTIVKAIGRGFNPEVAFLLTAEENVLEILDISDYSGGAKHKLIRVRARAIGSEGKARKYIEELTGTHISIFGKTVSIIGSYEMAALARKAMDSLLLGQRHATVYAWLEKHTKETHGKFY